MSGLVRRPVSLPFCSESCKVKITHFAADANQNGPRFLLALFFLVIVLPLVSILIPHLTGKVWGERLASLTVFLMGALMIRFPYATPQTNALLGMNLSMKATRFVAFVLMVLGLLSFYGRLK